MNISIYDPKKNNYCKCEYYMCVPHVQKVKGYLMHSSDAVLIPNCAFDCPCFFYVGPKPPSEGCFSDVRGPIRTTNPKQSQKDCQYENCSHFWECFWNCSKQCRKIISNHVPI